MKPLEADNQTRHTVTELLQLISALLTEVHPQQTDRKAITLDSHFENDLGLDSLARVELISRVEKKFGLALTEQSYAETQTARDLLRVIQSTGSPRAALHRLDAQAAVITENIEQTPDDAATLIDVLDWHVRNQPGRGHIRFYSDAGDGDVISFQQLKNAALRVAGGLQQQGLKPAEPVVLMLPSCADYFYCFIGIILAGGIPVPIYPPTQSSQLEDHIHRHVRIISNCGARIFITTSEARPAAQLLKSLVPTLRHIVCATELQSATALAMPPLIRATDIVFLQYTSGSTGNPKGVILTHRNLLANIRAMGKAVNASSDDVFVSWLPLYHDMGLIGAWLGSLYYAMQFVVMSPLRFLARPERWLWAIHHYHGTLSASPNFGYEYCLRRLNDDDLKGLDLSSWRAAFNGAEAVSPQTLEKFSQRFKACGFKAGAMMPVYGLAESTVGLTFPPLNRGPLIDQVDRATFMKTGIARKAEPLDQQPLKFVSTGPPLAQHQIRIIDQAGHELPERHEGRLEFKGPSATSGYYHDSEKTRSLFDENWLDSGDRAYIAMGELFITGRIKDIIIRAGRNIYPHELEEAIGDIKGIRTGRVAVFGSEDQQTGTERLIVMAESRSKDQQTRERLQTAINTLSADLTGSPPDQVILVPAGTILKTSSGKVRRTACRELFEKNAIGKKQPGVIWQVLRISLASIRPELQRFWRYSKSFIYAAHCWLIYCLLAPLTWLATMFLPGFKLRWSIARNCARLLGKGTATSVTVNGLENIPAEGQAYVLVANHASYLDSYALIATIPGQLRFVAKKDLGRYFFNRIPLKHIHTEFVDRYETGKSIADTRRLAAILKAGNALMFFAEGTFTRIPGLRPFYLGAFSVAAETGTRVIPVAIRGTRSILRSDSWFPHHGSITINIGEAIDPGDIKHQDQWHVALELRNRSRAYILRHCGEPDLAQEATPFSE